MAEMNARKTDDISTAELTSYRTPPGQLEPEKEQVMKPSTTDRTEGKIHEMKGKVKEAVGKATNNPNLTASGTAEKNAGKVQKWIGKAEKAVGE